MKNSNLSLHHAFAQTIALVGHISQQFKHNLYCLGFGIFIEMNMYM